MIYTSRYYAVILDLRRSISLNYSPLKRRKIKKTATWLAVVSRKALRVEPNTGPAVRVTRWNLATL